MCFHFQPSGCWPHHTAHICKFLSTFGVLNRCTMVMGVTVVVYSNTVSVLVVTN